VKCVTFVSDTFTRYGSKITKVWQEILMPVTLAFSGKVVQLWKSVNICKSYGEKSVAHFLCGHGVYLYRYGKILADSCVQKMCILSTIQEFLHLLPCTFGSRRTN